MWSTPSSIARRRTARAASGSRGGPKTPGPASCIAPKPMRLTGLSPRFEVWVMRSQPPLASTARTRRGSILGLAPPPTRREELAEFLRAAPRAHDAPSASACSAGGRRRTPGLRREEVSQLAGVGLSWYTWLEQGRDITPSAQRARRARARARPRPRRARAPLRPRRRRACRPPPAPTRPRRRPSCAAVVDGAGAQPRLPARPAHRRAGLEPRRDRAARHAPQAPDGRTNLLWWLFTDPGAAARSRARRPPRNTLARFRAEHARRYDDPAFTSLIGALLDASPALPRAVAAPRGARRAARDEDARAPASSARCVLHHLQSIPTSHPDLRLTQFVPADDAHARGARRLTQVPLGRPATGCLGGESFSRFARRSAASCLSTRDASASSSERSAGVLRLGWEARRLAPCPRQYSPRAVRSLTRGPPSPARARSHRSSRCTGGPTRSPCRGRSARTADRRAPRSCPRSG